MEFYNLSINIKQRKCVVVGGGKIALRKVRKLSTAEANVVVISPECLAEFNEENVTIIYREYSKEVLQDSVLVFAATSNFKVNQQVCKDAKSLGIWVSSVNGAEYGSFIVPASCKKNILTLGITTEGKAPALSKELRKYLQNKIANIDDYLFEEIVLLRKQKISLKNSEEKKHLEQIIVNRVTDIINKIEEN